MPQKSGQPAWAGSPQLRPYRPPEEDYGPIGPDSTLSELYRHHYEPHVLLPDLPAGVTAEDSRNCEAYRQALQLWIEATGDPPLSQIDQATCSQFLEAAKGRPGRNGNTTVSVNTIRKYCRQLQPLLDCAGPPDKRNRMGLDLYGELEVAGQRRRQPIPYLKPPKRRRKAAVDMFSLEELDRWLAVFPLASEPRLPVEGIIPAEWWRSLVLTLYNTGARIGTGLALRWEWYDGQRFLIPAEGIKGHDDRVLWVNTAAQAALEAVRGGRSTGPCFPWPLPRRQLDRWRVRLLQLAQIDPRGHGFHALRKSLISHLMGQDSGIAQMVAGHADLRTTIDSYTHPELKRMRELLDQAPQPDPSRVDPQGRMF